MKIHNPALIEAVKQGFNICFETISLSNDRTSNDIRFGNVKNATPDERLEDRSEYISRYGNIGEYLYDQDINSLNKNVDLIINLFNSGDTDTATDLLDELIAYHVGTSNNVDIVISNYIKSKITHNSINESIQQEPKFKFAVACKGSPHWHTCHKTKESALKEISKKSDPSKFEVREGDFKLR